MTNGQLLAAIAGLLAIQAVLLVRHMNAKVNPISKRVGAVLQYMDGIGSRDE